MRTIVPCSILLVLAGCAPNAPETAKTQDATAEFRPRIEKILAAWSSLDMKNVAPFYAKDPGLLFFDVAPLKYNGWADYEKGFQQIAGTWKSAKLSLVDCQAAKSGSVAWAAYTASIEIEPKEGPPIKGMTRGTDVFEKRGDDWIVVHEHASMPWEPAPPPAAPAKKAKKR